jgi:hypothetical protein
MKTLKAIAGYALAAYAVLSLTACPSTNNGSDNSTPAAVTPLTCTVGINGQYVNQYGQPCSGGATFCSGYTYNAQTGTYIGPNGQQIPASSCGSAIPSTGYTGTNYVSGCQGWTQYYQSQGYNVMYVPVNIGGGQLVCVDYNQLSQQYNFGQYNQAYIDPNYWYSYPPTAYQSGYYGNYGYNSCASNVNLGFSTGGVGAGVSLCF